jgi:hypothetical protein
VKIYEDAGPIQRPHVAVNDSGVAMAVGTFNGVGQHKAWAKRWVEGAG